MQVTISLFRIETWYQPLISATVISYRIGYQSIPQ